MSGPDSTTEQALAGVDLAGRTAVVTGATGGIGLAVATALARHGARVVLAGRVTDADPDRGERARAAVAAVATGPGAAEFVPLDLCDLADVRRCADDLTRRHPAISVLVNNAGVMGPPWQTTADGFELHLATNHLGPYVLTNRLLPALAAGAPGRVVNVTSGGPALVPFRWDDPTYEFDGYDKFEAYAVSKTATLLHAVALDRRLAATGVRAFAANPGLTATDLGRHLSRDDVRTLLRRAVAAAGRGGSRALVARTPDQGAATVVWAAASPDLADRGGVLCEGCAVVDIPTALVADDAAERLWALSAKLTGERDDPMVHR